MHFYIADFAETGGKQSIGKVQKLARGAIKTMGLFTEKDLEDFFEDRIKARVEGMSKKKAKAIAEKMQQQVMGIQPVFEDAQNIVDHVYDGVLLEQAVVITAAAMEAYWEDLLTDVMEKNRAPFEEAAAGQIDQKLRYQHMLRASDDLDRAYALAIIANASSARFEHRLAVLQRFVEPKALSIPEDDVRTLNVVVEQRNLFLHHAGIVNESYRRRTATRPPLDERLPLHLKKVEASIEAASRSVGIVHKQFSSAARAVKRN